MMRLQDLQGRQLGRYQITGVLGRGGMAAVYRAHDTGLRRDVALKVLYPHYGTDPSLLERFQREAIVAARLDHPNIVPIYDVGEEDGFVYIAMKLLHGRSLADRLREEPILPVDELVPIVEQIASALDYAHARGVIHRDIKAGNILLEPPDRVLLADFGIAKSLDAPGMTSTGVLIGTPDYMAPEQIANQAVDGRADIYALGVLVFRALTGRLPFEGSTEQVLLGHLHGTIPDPSMLMPSLPVAVDAVVQKALARQPAQRYSKAGEFVHDLRVALGIGMPTPPPARRGFEGRAVVPTVAANQYVQPRIGADEPTRRGAAAPPPARPAAANQRARADDPTLRGTVAPSPARTASSMPAPVQRSFPAWPVILVLLMLLGGGGYVLANTFRRGDNGDNPGAVIAALTHTPTLSVPTLMPTNAPPAEAATAAIIAEPATAEPTSMPTAPAAPTATSNTGAATPAPAPTHAPTTRPAASPTTQPTTRPTSAPTNTQQPTSAPTNTPQPTLAPTETPQPTEAPAPTVAPTEVAGAPCEVAVTGGFGALLEQRVGVQQRLGCPTAPEQGGDVAEQPFEHGSMLWFKNNNTIYVFIGKNATGKHLDFPPDQQQGPDDPPSATPPPGTQAPASGFGLVWDSHAAVRQQVGYATAPEAGPFAGAYQPFENGVMLFSPSGLGDGKTIYVLYNNGRLEQYADPTR
ncbi:MAG TPA: protein kinase [Roseiflexaceae bacterium]|nr:protein kinase [Roseiflexaceae bacterium]